MASLRSIERSDGTSAHRVLFRHESRQTCLTFDDLAVAQVFKESIDKLGVARALQLHRVERAPRGVADELSVHDWMEHHIAHLTGVDPGTIASYRRYVKNDIDPTLGALPLRNLSRDDIARWVQVLEGKFAAKTVANKHAFLSGALATAVRANKIPANPADGTRLPRGERKEMVFLTREEFAALLATTTDPWKPLVEFLVASGARWSEITALKSGDVDRSESTVRIVRAWKKGEGGGYQLGPPKTKKSRRTINVPAEVLDKLDYTGEWLFTKPGRGGHAVDGPVRGQSFRINVWNPAVQRAGLEPRPRIHDLRHTCASWLIQAGVPLPVIQQHLGHESIQTTVDVYGHLDRRSAQAAASAIAAALR